jgi:hypothetical protein
VLQAGPNSVPNSAQQEAKNQVITVKKGFRLRSRARRVRDSNPGARCRAYGFQDRRFRPLSQLSGWEKPLYDRGFLCLPAFGFEANVPHGGHSVALRISRRAGFESRVRRWQPQPAACWKRDGCRFGGSGHVSRRMPQDTCGATRSTPDAISHDPAVCRTAVRAASYIDARD